MTTSVLKMQRELVAVTEERDRLAAELAKLAKQEPVRWWVCGQYFTEEESALQFAIGVPGAKVQPLYAAPVPAVAAPAVLVDDASHDGLSVQAYHEWIRCALRLPDAAPMRFDFYAQEIERRLAVPAPSVPEEWREKLLAGFPLLDEEGLCQEKHHCEWALLQDRKRLHAMLQSAEVRHE